MERKRRLERAGLQWGGLALVAQLWVALVFVRRFLFDWDATKPQLVSFAESVNRFSQLKAPALKYPWAGIYLALVAVALSIIIGWLTIAGLREAMAAEPLARDDSCDDDDDDDADADDLTARR